MEQKKRKKFEMTSLKLFALKKGLRNRKHRIGYSIVAREHKHCVTYQTAIYLKQCDTYEEAEKIAKQAITVLRHKLGLIV